MISKTLVCAVLAAFTCQLVSAEQKCQPENIEASTPTSRFQIGENQTVTDPLTGLMWKTCLEGKTGAACEEGEASMLTWGATLLHLPQVNIDGGFAGYTDWRLPNIRELSTLVEMQCAHPAINLEVFPNAPAVHVWTSSPYQFYTHYSWLVDFAYGAPTYDERIREKGVRLVRDLK